MQAGNAQPGIVAQMLIRRPVEEVYEAFVEPGITTKFWFTRSSGRLEAGSEVRWDWEMYGVSDRVYVVEIEKDQRIRIRWSDGSETEWTFLARPDHTAYVSISTYGYSGDAKAQAARAVDDMGGYTIVLCGAKAYLEHGVVLNLVADKAPDANV